MPKKQKLNDPAFRSTADPALAKLRKRIMVQAAMAATAVGLTVVMLFGMTVAWYTNIVHTSGLTFEVEPWGFDGIVNVLDMDPIIAGPGDDGLIELDVTSHSDSPSAVSVSISKDAMATQVTADGETEGAEMQKRIYFYVDTQMVRNGETMDRVYLNSRESYTYNLFSKGKLTLTEAVHNAPLLKWHWVYDMLGYYVEGYPQTLSDGFNTESFVVTEYLRPIEYDYNLATIEYDADNGINTITTVDGTQTMEEFLVELSKTDGYKGEIDPKDKLVTGYYPVAVDKETGKGVYAYLCTYSEVEAGIIKDTALAEMTSQTTYTAKLMISAQKSKNSVINVSTLAGLTSAIEQGIADSIQLSSNVTFDKPLTITQGQRVMLDLNGKTIEVNDPTIVPVVVKEGGSLTMVNGTIAYNTENGGKPVAIQSTGAEIVMNNVTLTGFYRGMVVTDNAIDEDPTDEITPMGLDSTIRLVKCSWTTTDYGLMAYGNGATSEQKTQVIIEDSTLNCGTYGIVGNGNADAYGTDIQVINSTITSNVENVYSGIYQPQKDSVLTIYNSKISGYTGIALKAGTLNILGSDITGLGAGMDEITSASGSGFNDTGDAVYIETNYPHAIELNISDLVTIGEDGKTTAPDPSNLRSTNRYGLRVYEIDASNVEINLTGGTYQRMQDSAMFSTYFDAEHYVLTEKDNIYTITAKTASAG